MDELNLKIDYDYPVRELIMGTPEMNGNGERFSDFVSLLAWWFLERVFQLKDIHKVTSVFHDGNTEDHII